MMRETYFWKTKRESNGGLKTGYNFRIYLTGKPSDKGPKFKEEKYLKPLKFKTTFMETLVEEGLSLGDLELNNKPPSDYTSEEQWEVQLPLSVRDMKRITVYNLFNT